jgi:tRNA A-37 threonylcarbamoyl transferase component Bud32
MQTAAQLKRSLEALLPFDVTIKGRKYTLHSGVASGRRGVLAKASDEYGNTWAIKFCLPSDYEDRSFLQEISRASRLRQFHQFAQLTDADLIALQVGEAEVNVVVFVEQWIDGLTLEQFVKQYPRSVTTSFFLGYVRQMAQALSYLSTADLRHDDLLARNVMVCPPRPGSLDQEWTIRIVDMGSLKPKDSPMTKDRDDHENVVHHLLLLRNTIHRARPLGFRERRFLHATKGLLSSMLDEDLTIALRDPGQIVAQFNLALQRAQATRANATLTLSSPFEFFSAEHIADDALLVKLFAETCPWLEKVTTSDPCLVTGPRGCGKSTIFRWMSLKAHLHKPYSDISRLKLSGFYISCSMDLQNRLGWIKTKGIAQRFRREITHYFNLIAAREVINTLQLVVARTDCDSHWGLGEQQEKEIHEFFLRSLVGFSGPRLQGVSRFAQTREMIERAMFDAHDSMLRGVQLPSSLPETFLGDLTTMLGRLLPFFEQRRIVFLVDDFSVHRLSEPVQIVLNRIIWERRSSHIFKLSSEKYGAVLTDSFSATIDVTREMQEIDCGREYVSLEDHAKSKRALKFAIELLDNRLEAANYLGRAGTLIGKSSWTEKSLDLALANKERGRNEGQYHGIETISRLCSGDVASLLMVYSKIFELGDVHADTNTAVQPVLQHRAIRETSRRLMDAIRPAVPHGAEMYAVVNAFGSLVRNVLVEGNPQRKGKVTVRSQIPRIEIDQPEGSAIDRLNSTQQGIAKELIRRAAFIEMVPGLSRHGNVTTLRWQLRRIYLPAFGAALSKNNAVKRDVTWFKFFLTEPEGACDSVWNSWPKETPPELVPPLFKTNQDH